MARKQGQPHSLQVVKPLYCVCGFASRKAFAIGTITGMRSISVTCVVLGNMANLDAERGRRSPKISPPFRRNISEMCSSRTPSASPWIKNIGALVVGQEIGFRNIRP